jgi:hypothetical protein
MTKEERNKAIEKIQSDVEDIKRDVAWIIRYLLKKDEPSPIPPYVPYPPNDIDPYNVVTKCLKCGMEFKGVTGYVCADNHCPTFMKPWSGRGVSKITTTGGSWQSYNERTKE